MKLALPLLLVASTARGDVDWAKGLVTADGLGIADRHAPSPAVALSTSRHVAEDAARRVLREQVGTLPVASGGTLATRAKAADVQARVDRAIADAFVVDAEPETDGSWHVTMALPIEAVRQALVGPRTLAPGGDDSVPVVVVDGAAAKPAMGYRIGGFDAAAVFVEDVPGWAHDAPHVRATRGHGDAIELANKLGGPATVFVIAGKR